MIADGEMRDLFRIESGEHLQAIESGLLRMEKNPADSALLEELFREAHSLKGAARMLDLLDIERIFHRFEDILGHARSGTQDLSSMLIDRMYQSLEAIRRLVDEAVGGVAAEVDVNAIVESLKPLASSATAASAPGSTPSHSTVTQAEASVEVAPTQIDELFNVSSAILNEKASAGQFVIETIRVETRKLDTLMTHAGELTVAKVRIAQRHRELEELQTLWEQLGLQMRRMAFDNPALALLSMQFTASVEHLVNAAAEDSTRLNFVAGELEDGIRAARLLPLSTIFSLFQTMLRKLARECKKEVTLSIEGGEIAADKRILEEIKDPLMHILRNAVDHGIESPEQRSAAGKPPCGRIQLRAQQLSSTIRIDIEDDGGGLDLAAIRRSALKKNLMPASEIAALADEQVMNLIFMPGFSTSNFISDVSGRGVGMDVVRANVVRLKGTVTVASVPGVSCRISIDLPLTLATSRVLIIVDQAVKYAIPVEYVEKSCHIGPEQLFTIDGQQVLMFDDVAIAAARLKNLLQFHRADFLPPAANQPARLADAHAPCIILQVDGERIGLIVDELLDEQEIVLKSQSMLLRKINDLSGVTILGSGEVCMVLHPPDFLAQLQQFSSQDSNAAVAAPSLILLAEDSLSTRAQLKRILEAGGYQVVLAIDGLDAYGKLENQAFRAVVSDINMPNMDGLMLTQKIRADKRFAELPVILVTMQASAADQKRGMDAGANAYISKATFEQSLLLDTLHRLI
ncbi:MULTISPECIES: hybrid sensor histidine kinase/response regulator [unclassified Undibacterium]|uniref:hybrid sensor histidine kinase/response regulator n=1 Tax=unclassified Undibacterium TaxID=2630295 RepID=UPI002AC93898|nr:MULTISPECIES: hybrid sensor histidine kinase/response regulator [unclassified Undibacterium]MEB0138618.1 hybrid sensor histidine kinase/response regulator [Undibacterium sp. CCC2.1]MEB0171419.1 hybrid sensor histidine kinase/response regulator [Undibacterium sp. CCC1.1]MEB0175749.1 hybrid sensor histidine kinase/response regulator [Undibacterium sp. CCC3.4]MEB0214423.1 hybrid sensor histidine kinase/response regulator [Undibacterium sp. 5I2]WPX44288.1 hybrid sensor histidine kinase/response